MSAHIGVTVEVLCIFAMFKYILYIPVVIMCSFIAVITVNMPQLINMIVPFFIRSKICWENFLPGFIYVVIKESSAPAAPSPVDNILSDS